MTQETQPQERPQANVRDGRFSFMVVSAILAVGLAVAALAIPVPYVIESPGPAINTIGKIDGKQLITVTGHESFTPTSGTLDLTTIHLNGGLPEDPINIFQALSAWTKPSDAVYPAELIYAPGVSQSSVNSENTAAMTSSQENATAAALGALGIKYKAALAVGEVPAGGASVGILKANDVLNTINGKTISTLSVIQQELAAGKGAPVKLGITRAGKDMEVSVTPKIGSTGKYLLGITIAQTFVFPFEIKVTLENVGGPSAGMMFALGMMDTLTPGELTGGKAFAGTGTIDPDGNVGAIGGIAQKMVGAKDNGAKYFLAPAANCSDVVGHVPNGLQVIKVATLKEAYAAVETIGSGKDGSKLPTCS